MEQHNLSEPSISTALKIEVLLAEYISLREEAMQRDTVLNQALLGAAAAIIGFVTIMIAYAAWLTSSVAIAVVVVLVYRAFARIEREVAELSKCLVKLEGSINELSGEQLLEWETKNGLSVTGREPRGWLDRVVGFVGALSLGPWRRPS